MKGKDLIITVLATFCLTSLLFAVLPSSSQTGHEYDPWIDSNDDGTIDIYDAIRLANVFGTSGTSITKATIEYDSGWVNVTDKCGQYFNITHNLGSTDLIVDITGRASIESATHQRSLGVDSSPGWERTYRAIGIVGRLDECARSLIQTSDGGFALAGYTTSIGGGNKDFWLVKTDKSGYMRWNQAYGGAGDDEACSLVQTDDGGYAIAGTTNSTGAGGFDLWLVKTDSAGGIQWNMTYGGAGDDKANSMVQTVDGGYAIAGDTQSFGIEENGLYLVKTFPDGSFNWSRTFGGSFNVEFAHSLIQTTDEGFAMTGYWMLGAGVLIKTEKDGIEQWRHPFSGLNDAFHPVLVVQASDDGYMLAGTGNSQGVTNPYLVRMDSNGNLLWSRHFGGGFAGREFYSFAQTNDGGYILAGNTVYDNNYDSDFFAIKTDASCNNMWEVAFGGIGDDRVCSVVQAADGGFALAGHTNSYSSDGQDAWLVKTEAEIGLTWTDSTTNIITLYRGETDPFWDFVRIRIWAAKTP